MVALRLASAGYCGGEPERVMKMNAEWVAKTLAYENFKAEYEEVFIEMNREKGA